MHSPCYDFSYTAPLFRIRWPDPAAHPAKFVLNLSLIPNSALSPFTYRPNIERGLPGKEDFSAS